MKWGIRKQPDGGTARTGSAADESTGYEPKSPGTRAGQTRRERRAAKKTARKTKNPSYKKPQRSLDRRRFGAFGVKRINQKMNEGSSYRDAARSEVKRSRRRNTALMLAGAGMMLFGDDIARTTLKGISGLEKAAGNAATKIKMERGEKAARNLFADNKGLTSYQTVHLKFNRVKDIWE